MVKIEYVKWLLGEDLFAQLSGWVYQAVGIRPRVLADLLDTLLAVLVYFLLRRWLKNLFLRRIAEIGRWYVVSKTISYVLSVILIVVIFACALIWARIDERRRGGRAPDGMDRPEEGA